MFVKFQTMKVYVFHFFNFLVLIENFKLVILEMVYIIFFLMLVFSIVRDNPFTANH